MKKLKIVNRINTIALKYINSIQYPILECLCRKKIYIIAYANKIFNRTIKNNLGDDLNIDMIESLSNCKIIKYEYSLFSRFNKNVVYSFIGSILEYVIQTKPDAIVWGTGFKFAHNNFSYEELCKLDIRAVRGPRTRQILIDKGIKCPPIYGDPGILISQFYKPQNIIKKYELGIIPHNDDLNNDIIGKLSNLPNAKLLPLKHYASIKAFVDDICSCKIILSTSLHGLIISDSYKIPNLWISVSNNIEGGDFKFYDYYEGVKKKPYKIKLDEELNMNKIYSHIALWDEPSVSKEFIEACPIKLNL